jgi:hypothetical protein
VVDAGQAGGFQAGGEHDMRAFAAEDTNGRIAA